MNTTKIPRTLLVIGWTFIIISILSVLSGIICMVVFFAFRRMPPGEIRALSESMTQTDAISLLVLNYAGMLAFAQIIPAVIVLIVSIFFLKLRAWARTGVEIICWTGIACSILGLITICTLWFSRMPGFASYTTGANMVFSLALSIAAAVPLVFVIKYMRRSDIRGVYKDHKLNE